MLYTSLVFWTMQYFYGKYEDWVFKGLAEFDRVYGKDIAHQKKKEQEVRKYCSSVVYVYVHTSVIHSQR